MRWLSFGGDPEVTSFVSGTHINIGIEDEVSIGFAKETALNWLLCIVLSRTLGGYGGLAGELARHSRHGGAHGRICKYGVNSTTSTTNDALILVRSITSGICGRTKFA